MRPGGPRSGRQMPSGAYRRTAPEQRGTKSRPWSRTAAASWPAGLERHGLPKSSQMGSVLSEIHRALGLQLLGRLLCESRVISFPRGFGLSNR